jgi:transcriptional regulator with XRE-family HTH domain
MMKSKHPLEEWREAHCYSRPAFGRLLAKHLGKQVSRQAIAAWETGQAAPTLAKAEAIRKVTGGKVRPESFLKSS